MRRLLRCVPISLALLLGASAADAAVWQKLAALPKPEQYAGDAIALADGRAFLLTGTSSYFYDPVGDAWSSAPVPSTGHPGAPCINVVAVGARDVLCVYDTASTTTTGWVWSTATGTWQATGPFINNRAQAAATRLPDGRVLVVGGQLPSTGTTTSTCEIYDPKSNTWSPAASVANGRLFGTLMVGADGRAYLVGGYDKASMKALPVEAYDPVANTWTAGVVPPMSLSAYQVAVATASKKFVYSDISQSSLFVFDTATLSFAKIAIPFEAGPIASVGGEFILAISNWNPTTPSDVPPKPSVAVIDVGTGSVKPLPAPEDGVLWSFGLVGLRNEALVIGGSSHYAPGSPPNPNAIANVDAYVQLPVGTPCSDADTCSAGACMAGKCSASCSADADCATGTYCKGGSCIPSLTLGAACTADTQCITDHCLSKHCCADAKGCSPYVCTATGCASPCKSNDDCSTGNVCKSSECVPAGGTPTCSSDRTSFTDGAGVTHPCSPVLCDQATGICGSVCTTNADCAVDHFCESTGQCVVPVTQAKSGCDVASMDRGGPSAAWIALAPFAAALMRIRRNRQRRDDRN